MISADDFVHLAYTPDLSEAGIVVARHALPRIYARGGRGLYDTVRRSVAATALQLAFRRYLTEQGIAFGVQPAMPFSDPDGYQLEMHDRRCELKCFLISKPAQIEALSSDPGLALAAPALVPMDRHAAVTLGGADLYLFAFVSALLDGGGVDRQFELAPRRQEVWMHIMPAAWMRPQTWSPLRPLILKSESGRTIDVTISGEDGSRNPLELAVRLPSGERMEVDAPLHCLSHVSVVERPSGRIGIHSRSRRTTHVVESSDWHNLWLDGRDICLLGWITLDQFRARARLVPEGRRVFQFSRTRTKNLAVEVSHLRPIRQLLERIHDRRI